MANRKLAKTYNKANRGINRNARELERVRETGYTALDKAIGQLYKNLKTTQRGYAGQLTSKNARNLEMTLARTARARRANNRTTHAVVRQNNAYLDSGGMLGEELGRLSTRTKQANRSSARMSKAGDRYIGVTSRTAKDAMSIIRGSAKEQQANANQLAAEALAERVGEDSALIAQQQHELSMAQLNHQYQMAEMRKQYEMQKQQAKWEQKQAEKVVGSQNYQTLRPMLDASTRIAQYVLEHQGEDINTILDGMVTTGIIDEADKATQVVKQLVTNLTTNTQPGDDALKLAAEIEDAFKADSRWSTLSKKQKDKLKTLIAKEYTAAEIERLIAASEYEGYGRGDEANEDAGPGVLDILSKLRLPWAP